MKFKADIATCENGKDKILSVCQSNPGGDVRHEIIIQRGPKEFDFLIEHPGPQISCEDLGLELEPGQALFAVGTVEPDTGIGRVTPRIRERRNGVPTPERNVKGERLYNAEPIALAFTGDIGTPTATFSDVRNGGW